MVPERGWILAFPLRLECLRHQADRQALRSLQHPSPIPLLQLHARWPRFAPGGPDLVPGACEARSFDPASCGKNGGPDRLSAFRFFAGCGDSLRSIGTGCRFAMVAAMELSQAGERAEGLAVQARCASGAACDRCWTAWRSGGGDRRREPRRCRGSIGRSWRIPVRSRPEQACRQWSVPRAGDRNGSGLPPSGRRTEARPGMTPWNGSCPFGKILPKLPPIRSPSGFFPRNASSPCSFSQMGSGKRTGSMAFAWKGGSCMARFRISSILTLEPMSELDGAGRPA